MELTSFIYGIKGNLVKTIDYGSLDIGTHYLKWNGSNEKGSRVESGVYFLRFKEMDLMRLENYFSKIVLRMMINKIKLTNS